MTKKEECNEFQKFISGFLNEYISKQRGLSSHTLRSYRQTLIAFIKFIASTRDVAFNKIRFADIDRSIVLAFLDTYDDKGCSASTRNQRRAAIASFYKYVATIDPTKCYQCQLIRSIPNKKFNKKAGETVLTPNQIRLIIEQANKNLNPRLQKRDTLFLTMLYEWGLRISEITSLNIGALNLWSNAPYVTVFGKGSKYRYVNISKGSVAMIIDYANWFGIDLRRDEETPLFFTTHKGQREHMTNVTASQFLKKYADQAREIDPTIPERVHPHLFRHSRATHLLDQDVSLAYISKFLGHEHFSTTERYVRVNPKTVQEKIANCAMKDKERFGDILNPTPFKLSDESEIAKLYGIAE